MSRLLEHGRRGRADPGAAEEFQMYVIDAPDEPTDGHGSIADTLEKWLAALTAFQDHAKVINSPGGFVAPQADFPTLTGFREDIQVTLHADPRRASAVAIERTLPAADIKGLRVEETSLRTHKTELSWRVTLRTSPWRRRRAMLRISPSPSLNVTVIRLTPVKSQRFATRAFIRAGLRAAYELVARLEHELGEPVPGTCLPRGSNPEPMD